MSLFLTSRRKIREVEVEVLNPGGVGGFTAVELEYPDPWAEARRTHAEMNGGEVPVGLREGVTMGPQALRGLEPAPQLIGAVKAEQAATPIEAVEVPEPIDTVDPESADVDEPDSAQPLATELTCEIVFWRGYRKSAFYARIFDEAGDPLAVAESPFFRSSGDGTPDATNEAESAYDDLCERLERDGWNWVDQGSTWYGDVFQRDVTDVAEPEPA